MNSFFLLFLFVYNVNGQVILNIKDHALLEQKILENIRRPILELVNAFLYRAQAQIDQIRRIQKEAYEKLSEQIQVLNLTQTTLNQGDGNKQYAAFSAYLTVRITSSYKNQVVVYDKVETNYGNAYDASTGVFTCPTSGIYVFHWTIRSSNGAATKLMVNQEIKPFATNTNNQGHGSESASSDAVLSLKKGNKVRIFITSHGCILDATYTTFQGWLQKSF